MRRNNGGAVISCPADSLYTAKYNKLRSPNDSLAGSSIIVPVAHVCRVVPRDGDGACAVGACGCEPAGVPNGGGRRLGSRSEEHTSELQSLMRISYAVFCLKQKKQ